MKKKDRNARFRPWEKLVQFDVPEELEKRGVVASYQNKWATVFLKEAIGHGLSNPDGTPMTVAHLVIHWDKDLKCNDSFFYRTKQRIKNEICGPNSEYVEIGPSVWRELKDLVDTQLWVTPEGGMFPLGLFPNDMEDAIAEAVGGEENIVRQEDLELFVVRHADGIVEVFYDELECKKMYKSSESEISNMSICAIERIGEVPVASENVAWTESAKGKLDLVLRKSEAARRAMCPEEKELSLFYGGDTIEDELIENEMGDDDDDNIGLEEQLALASAMREAIPSSSDNRVKKFQKVTQELLDKNKNNVRELRKSIKKPKIILP